MLQAISVSSATLLAAVLSVAPLRAQEEPAVAATAVDASWRDRLTELVRAAVAQSPDLLAMKLQVDAVRHRAPQTDALPESTQWVGQRWDRSNRKGGEWR